MATSPRRKRSTTAHTAAQHHVVEKSPTSRQITGAVVHVVSPLQPLPDVERVSKSPFEQEMRSPRGPRSPEVQRMQKTAFTPSINYLAPYL